MVWFAREGMALASVAAFVWMIAEAARLVG